MDERRIALNRLLAAACRKRAAEHDLAASAIKTAHALKGLVRAYEKTLAPYEAERAAAHFEGRVPPSFEVFVAETEVPSDDADDNT